jgi:shikimate dehydrogenase
LGSELRGAVDATAIDVKERPGALVLGCGGAALAAVVGCRLAGIGEIYVTARRYTPELPRAEWPRAAHFERLGAQLLPWWDAGMPSAPLSKLHLLIQATSAGMKGAPGGEELAALVPFSELSPLVAYDLVYTPRETPFLRMAGKSGHRVQNGLGMLVGQARDALRIWLGRSPSQNELMRAAEGALGS